MTPDLVDERQRTRIREDLGAALFVEAGAGTGKTRELVERLLALVRAGASLRSIAAITFTEAAAAELRDRVRFALEEMHLSPHEASRSIARQALEELDGAALETLHSFSGRLLGLYPVEAGLPPRIQVLDDVAFAIAADEEWQRASTELLTRHELEAPLTYALALNVRIEGTRYGAGDLRGVFDAFGENWDRLPRDPVAIPPFGEPDVTPLIEALDEAVSHRNECRDPADRLLQRLDDLAEFRRRLAHATTPVQRARVLPTYIPEWGRYTSGRTPNWPDIRTVRDAVEHARELREEILADLGAAALTPLVDALRQAALEFADRRHREGTLSFHDLLVLARNLLRDNTQVRGELHARYSRILIDEFQDTDPLQGEIAHLLAADGGDAVAPGRVFFVGDAKQSIYRFRRADIAMFKSSRERFGCEPAVLGSNFRSTEAVIAWCNHVFAQFLKDEPGQAPYEPLSAARADPSGGSVHLLGGLLPGMRAGDAREVEAQAIAAAVRVAQSQGWRIYDRRLQGWRPARFDDVAVLIRSRTMLPHLQRSFEDLDIPYRVESRSLVYNTQEIRDLTSILAAIDDPSDEVAVVAALRSPAFACGDDDLLRHRRAGRQWDYMATAQPGDVNATPVEQAFAFLRELHERRFWLPLGELVERVIRERALREIAWAYRRPREHWQRYRFLLEQVRALEANQGANLRALVLWLRRQAEAAALVNESVIPEEDDDAVRVMTVHAAKGLEFPIVVVAGFGGASSPRAFVLWGEPGRLPEVKLGNAETPGFKDAFEVEKKMEAFERDRLLYVAATRARDHLLVSVFHTEAPRNSTDGPSDAQRLREASVTAPELWQAFEFDGVQPALRATAPTVEATTPLPARESWVSQRAALLQSQLPITFVAATGLVGDDEPALQDQSEGDAVFRRGRAATAVGRAVHAVLQSADLATGANIDRLARAEAAAESVPDRTAEVAELARAAIQSEPVRAAVASARYWREVFVSAESDGVLVEGFVDLAYESDDGLVIVDYKTDAAVADKEVAAAMEHYRLQGAAYAFALERNLGRPVAACRFLFLRPAGTRTVEIEDLPGAIAEMEARLRTIAEGSLVHSGDHGRR